MVELLTVSSISIHLICSLGITLQLYDDYIKEDKIHFIWIFMFPLINLILALRLMEIKKNSLKRKNEWMKEKIEDLEDRVNRSNTIWKSKIEEVERKKFRRVRVGDTFFFPQDGEWNEEVKGKRCKIIEINGKGVVGYVNDPNGGWDEETRWNTSWALMKEVASVAEFFVSLLFVYCVHHRSHLQVYRQNQNLFS